MEEQTMSYHDKKLSSRLENEKQSFSGMLFRTFTELDLLELQAIDKRVHSGLQLQEIDLDTISNTFNGHTIFSIFFDQIVVYEQILA